MEYANTMNPTRVSKHMHIMTYIANKAKPWQNVHVHTVALTITSD